MPHRHLLVQSAAREKILRGALALADAVRVTLGPKSKCVLIEKKVGPTARVQRRVTIAREFELEDHEENMGAQVIRQAAERTGDVVGDGTTTSTLLAAAIFADGVRNIAAGASAIDLKADRRRGGDSRRRAVGSGNEESARGVRGRDQRHQGGHGRRHRPRWRAGAVAGD